MVGADRVGAVLGTTPVRFGERQPVRARAERGEHGGRVEGRGGREVRSRGDPGGDRHGAHRKWPTRRPRHHRGPRGRRPPAAAACSLTRSPSGARPRPGLPPPAASGRGGGPGYPAPLSSDGLRKPGVHRGDDGPGRSGPLALTAQDRSPCPRSVLRGGFSRRMGRTGGEWPQTCPRTVVRDGSARRADLGRSLPAGPSTLRRGAVVVGLILLPLGAIILWSAPLLHANGWTGAGLVVGGASVLATGIGLVAAPRMPST